MRLRYAPRARSDIVHIHDYIARHNPRAATSVVRRIRSTCRLPCNRPPQRHPRIRVLAVGRYPYLVYRVVTTNELTIVHVRHGARTSPTNEEL